MSGTANAVFRPDFTDYAQPPQNRLAPQPTWADAATYNAQVVGDYIAQQRAKSEQMRLWDPNTGLPTGVGVVNAAQQYGSGLLMGTTAAGIRAFHGSPYDFERFDTSKIGTGEGAQAYGHGLYFAEREGTATGYRDDLSQKSYMTATGPEPYSNVYSALYHSQVGVHPNIAGPVATNVRNMIDEAGSIDKALEQYDVPNDPRYGPAYQQAIDAAKRMQLSTNPGKMYEVNIGADPEQFLHWDRPLSEQSPQVQEKLHAIGALPNPTAESTAGHFGYSLDEFNALPAERQQALIQQTPPSAASYRSNPTGGEIYQSSRLVPGQYRDPALAAQALQQAGIPGIRYLDQGSRGAGQGTHNYVVFDANTIDILRKYGLAGLGIGLGATAAGTQQQSQ